MPSSKTTAESFNLVAAIAALAFIASEFVWNMLTSEVGVGVIESCVGASLISSRGRAGDRNVNLAACGRIPHQHSPSL